jgi:hypothetical protein
MDSIAMVGKRNERNFEAEMLEANLTRTHQNQISAQMRFTSFLVKEVRTMKEKRR